MGLSQSWCQKINYGSALPSLGQRHCASVSPPAQVQLRPRPERTSQPSLGLDELSPAVAAERLASYYDTRPAGERR